MKNMKLIMENWRQFSLREQEESSLAQQIQQMIDNNQFLKGKVVAKEEDILEGKNFVLLFSDESARHIAARHMDGSKPGSLFNKGANLRDIAKDLLDTQPKEQAGGRVKWLDADAGQEVGAMGVSKESPDKVASMQDYTMPDGAKETVKIVGGKRDPTNVVNLITAELGQLSDGKKALSLITMFPGGNNVEGTTIPADRSKFAEAGLYFVVDNGSPLLQSGEKTVTKESLRRMIKRILRESDFDVQQKKKDRIYDDVEVRFADDYPVVYGMLPSMGEFENMSVEEYKRALAKEIPEYAEELGLQSMDDEDKEGSEFGF